MYTPTTATKRIFELKKRIRFIAGGTSASKTISILIWLIDYAQSVDNELISVVSETLPHLKRGAIRDFKSIMMQHSYWKDSQWNATDYTYTFETGTKLEFFSVDQPGKVRGPRRDILFLNEVNNISYDTYTQLEIRTKKIIWADYNPVSEFWFYTELKDQENVDFLTLTYKDNEALDKSIVEAIEAKRTNKNFWQVYGLGQLGDAQGRIYTEWQIIDEIPHQARLERRGIDFGYTNDPTAIIDVYKYNGGIILDELMYQKGLSNKQIADFINTQPTTLNIADSAEPKSIDELKSYGVNVIPATKGQGSVLQGIQKLQAQRVSITKRSINGIKEYRNYLWLEDKDGTIINTPSDIWNHFLDGARYAVSTINNEDKAIKDMINELPVEDWQKRRFY